MKQKNVEKLVAEAWKRGVEWGVANMLLATAWVTDLTDPMEPQEAFDLAFQEPLFPSPLSEEGEAVTLMVFRMLRLMVAALQAFEENAELA